MSDGPRRFARTPQRSEWLGVELRHLAALQSVARGQSFRRAAEDLGYVQSAISQQIAFLERQLDVRLIERSRGSRPVTLTPAGALMVAYVDDIIGHLGAAQSELAALADGRTGNLRVGAFDHVASGLMPSMLRCLAKRSPGIEIRLTEARTDGELLRLLESGNLDIVFADLPVPSQLLKWEQLAVEPYLLLVSAGSRHAAAAEVRSFDDLARLELIHQRGCRHALRVEAQLRGRGLCPRVVREADSSAGVQALVGAGIGSAFLPYSAIDQRDETTVCVSVGPLLAPRTLALAWHASRPVAAALSSFVDVADEVAAERQHALRGD